MPAIRTRLPLLLAALTVAAPASAQREADPNHGNPQLTQWGILDGNRVRTLYSNFGEIHGRSAALSAAFRAS